jgi:uncharacterized protein YeaO (DUF488 family)
MEHSVRLIRHSQLPLWPSALKDMARRPTLGGVAFRVKRVYDEPSPDDGYRVLVDRLWPRGVTKERAALDRWAKEIAPSTDLRVWFHHHPDEFDVFAERYRAELDANEAEVDLLREAGPVVTLLYSVRDHEHNHAVVLAAYLEG